MATIPVTGLSQLGDQLLRASGDYANIRLRRENEDKQRAQGLADLADQRRYAEGRSDIERGQRIEDTARLAQMNQRFEALKRAQQLGLIAATDLGNMAAEDLALTELAKREATEVARKEQMRARAQSRVDSNAAQMQAIMEKIAEDERVAASQPEINPVALRAEQERLARMANPDKKQISDADIAGQYNAAMESYEQKVMMDWAKRIQEAKINAANNKMLLRGLAEENNQLLQLYGAVGDVPRTMPQASPAAMLSAPRSDPMEAFQSTIAPAASIAPPIQEPSASPNQYPVTSLLGLAERAPPIQDVLAAPGNAIDAIGRYGGAGLQGLLSGDFSVPERGPVAMAGEGIGSLLSGPVQGPVDPVQVARTQWLQNAWRDPSNPPKPLGPLKNLDPNGQYKQLISRPPTSVFSYPDPYGSLMGP